MAYFIYVHSQTGPEAQIVHDEKLVDYVRGQNHLRVLSQHQLTVAEAELSIDELKKLYPAKG